MEEKKSAEGLGISGFTLGVLSIILAGWIGIVLALTGFAFCSVQQKKNPLKIAKAGIILSVIGFIVSIVFLIAYYKYLIPLTGGI